VPTLSIKNVPNALLDELRGRAARHHRSIQGELMALLTAAVEPANARVTVDVSGSPECSTGRRTGTRRIDEIAAEHRKRWKKPFSKVPRAVDLIRAERDAR
jgi:plasmid stability protein